MCEICSKLTIKTPEQHHRGRSGVTIVKACVRYFFFQTFIFLPNDSPSKIIKNVFHFIKKALFILEIFKFL